MASGSPLAQGRQNLVMKASRRSQGPRPWPIHRPQAWGRRPARALKRPSGATVMPSSSPRRSRPSAMPLGSLASGGFFKTSASCHQASTSARRRIAAADHAIDLLPRPALIDTSVVCAAAAGSLHSSCVRGACRLSPDRPLRAWHRRPSGTGGRNQTEPACRCQRLASSSESTRLRIRPVSG